VTVLAPRLLDALTSPGWCAVLADVLASERVRDLEAFLVAERAAGANVLPPPGEVFAALNGLEPEDVRVLVLGQDPYPTPGHAHGLAFSYRGAGALPRSLRNVLREVEEETGRSVPAGRGDLTPWARQGVLLLNTVLSVRAGEAGSHRGKGWDVVTDAVLAHLAARPQPLVALLWGGAARKKRALLGARTAILEAGHPSPLSIRHFRGCGHFLQANEVLTGPPVDWAAL